MDKDLEEEKGHGTQCINGEVALSRSRESSPVIKHGGQSICTVVGSLLQWVVER